MSSVQQELAGIAGLGDQKQRGEAYKAVLARVLKEATVEGCVAFVEHSESRGEWIGAYPGGTDSSNLRLGCVAVVRWRGLWG